MPIKHHPNSCPAIYIAYMKYPLKSPVMALYEAIDNALQGYPDAKEKIDLNRIKLIEKYVVFENGTLGIEVNVLLEYNGCILSGRSYYCGQ